MYRENLLGLQMSVVSVCRMRIIVSAISVSRLHHGCGRRVLPVHHVVHPRRVGARVSARACKIGPWLITIQMRQKHSLRRMRRRKGRGKREKRRIVNFCHFFCFIFCFANILFYFIWNSCWLKLQTFEYTISKSVKFIYIFLKFNIRKKHIFENQFINARHVRS